MRKLPAFYGFTGHSEITPNDSVAPSADIHAIYAKTSGTVNIVARDSNEAVSYTVQAGDIIPCISPRLIKATGTTATVIGWSHGDGS